MIDRINHPGPDSDLMFVKVFDKLIQYNQTVESG